MEKFPEQFQNVLAKIDQRRADRGHVQHQIESQPHFAARRQMLEYRQVRGTADRQILGQPLQCALQKGGNKWSHRLHLLHRIYPPENLFRALKL